MVVGQNAIAIAVPLDRQTQVGAAVIFATIVVVVAGEVKEGGRA